MPKGQEFDEYPFPIYLRSNQTLHLSWTVNRGDGIALIILTPSGKYVGLKSDGSLKEGLSSLLKHGLMILNPSEHGRVDGYYQMKPNLTTGGGRLATSEVTLQYGSRTEST